MAPKPKQMTSEMVDASDMESSSVESSASVSSLGSQKRKRAATQTPEKNAKKRARIEKASKNTNKAKNAGTSEDSEEESSGDEAGRKSSASKSATSHHTNGVTRRQSSLASSGTSSSSDPSDPPGPAAFEAPPGFTPATAAHSKKLASLFSPAALKGKQLFHIAAPASVPLSELTRLTASDLTSQKSVITHSGTKFGFVASSHSDETRFLVPSHKDRSKYDQLPMEITRSFRLQQITAPPMTKPKRSQTNGTERRAVNVHEVKEAKKQPEGLRTRYWPLGFEDNDYRSERAPAKAKPSNGNSTSGVKEVATAASSRGKRSQQEAKGGSDSEVSSTMSNSDDSSESARRVRPVATKVSSAGSNSAGKGSVSSEKQKIVSSGSDSSNESSSDSESEESE